VIREIFFENSPDNSIGLALIIYLPLFVFLSYPIHWSVYKSLNHDLQQRLNSIKETTTDLTRQHGQQLMQQQPTTVEIATVESALTAGELPFTVPHVQQFAGTNTAAEQVIRHMAF
jgi:hypothetical protein